MTPSLAGGLDQEFSDIFRRAFASRIFPVSVMQKMGISHVKGMMLHGPPGASTVGRAPNPPVTAEAGAGCCSRRRLCSRALLKGSAQGRWRQPPARVAGRGAGGTVPASSRPRPPLAHPSSRPRPSHRPTPRPPGTGKTLIARQIGKMLNGKEPKVVNGPEVLSKFVGQAEENVRKLFAEAEAECAARGKAALTRRTRLLRGQGRWGWGCRGWRRWRLRAGVAGALRVSGS